MTNINSTELNLHIENIYPGAEMLPFERYTVYRWITDIIKPENGILETGCGNGGSTYYLSQAIKKLNSRSIIHTCDPERKPFDDFLNQNSNVIYYKMYSADLISKLIYDKIKLDYIFFDGPDDPNIPMDEIKILEDYIQPGCYFSMHDWEIEKRKYDGAIANKSKLIRPYLEKSSYWQPIEILEGIESNQSVGFCLYKFLGK